MRPYQKHQQDVAPMSGRLNVSGDVRQQYLAGAMVDLEPRVARHTDLIIHRYFPVLVGGDAAEFFRSQASGGDIQHDLDDHLFRQRLFICG